MSILLVIHSCVHWFNTQSLEGTGDLAFRGPLGWVAKYLRAKAVYIMFLMIVASLNGLNANGFVLIREQNPLPRKNPVPTAVIILRTAIQLYSHKNGYD